MENALRCGFYAEAAGEDAAGYEPSRRGYIGGVLALPRILGADRVDFRSEIAYNHVKQVPNYWYNHIIYTQGYTNKGRIMGHHMGTDSGREPFVATFEFVVPGRIFALCDGEKRLIFFPHAGDQRRDRGGRPPAPAQRHRPEGVLPEHAA